MSNSSVIILSDSEDESYDQSAIAPIVNSDDEMVPYIDSPIVPSENEPSEYEPSEEEPSLTTYHILDEKKWTWVWDKLEEWRLEAGDSFVRNGASFSRTQVYPVDGKPPNHTLPLVISHITKLECKIEHIEDSLETLPGLDYFEDVHDHINKMGNELQKVQKDNKKLESWAHNDINRIDRIEDRLNRIEHNLGKVNRHICNVINQGRGPPN